MPLRLLFIHGWATDSRVWRYQKALAGEFDLSFIDLPGHGGKRGWESPDFGPPRRVLEGLLKGEETLCIGWSLGGELLLSLGGGLPENVRGLVVVGASPSFVRREGFNLGQPRHRVLRMKKELEKDLEAALERFYALNLSPGEDPCLLSHLKEAKKGLSRDDLLMALEALMEEDVRDRLLSIDVPVLIIHGTGDRVCPYGVTEYMKKRLRKVVVEAFEGAGHMPFLTEPDRFNAIVRSFARDLWKEGL